MNSYMLFHHCLFSKFWILSLIVVSIFRMASGTCVGAGRVHGHGTNAGDEDDLPPHPSTA